MTATHCTPCGHRLPGHYPVCEHYEQPEYVVFARYGQPFDPDTFHCKQCGPVIHAPIPEDEAHCPCPHNQDCGCACHNPSTLTAVI